MYNFHKLKEEIWLFYFFFFFFCRLLAVIQLIKFSYDKNMKTHEAYFILIKMVPVFPLFVNCATYPSYKTNLAVNVDCYSAFIRKKVFV